MSDYHVLVSRRQKQKRHQCQQATEPALLQTLAVSYVVPTAVMACALNQTHPGNNTAQRTHEFCSHGSGPSPSRNSLPADLFVEPSGISPPRLWTRGTHTSFARVLAPTSDPQQKKHVPACQKMSSASNKVKCSSSRKQCLHNFAKPGKTEHGLAKECVVVLRIDTVSGAPAAVSPGIVPQKAWKVSVNLTCNAFFGDGCSGVL